MAGLTGTRPGEDGRAVRVDIWSDLVCPWCYLGKRRLEHALRQVPDLSAQISWNAVPLDPQAPRFGEPGAGMPISTLMSERGIPPEGIEERQARVTLLAAEEGLEYHLDRSPRVNTLDAHLLIRSARDSQTATALVEHLFRAQHVEARRIDDPAVLASVAAAAGLEPDDRLNPAAASAAVQEDVEMARQLGIGGVPFFLFDRRLALSGAQPVTALVEALEAADRTAAAPAGS